MMTCTLLRLEREEGLCELLKGRSYSGVVLALLTGILGG